MKNIYLTLLVLMLAGISYSQETADIFEIARSGSLSEAQVAFRKNPKSANALNSDGYSPLILACYRGNLEVAKFLIESGSDINFKSAMGTPLMAAVVKKNIEIVALLIQKRADIHITDANGTTAIIYASMFKNHEVAKRLMQSGANADQKDSRGNSALDYAILANDDQLIEILKTKKL